MFFAYTRILLYNTASNLYHCRWTSRPVFFFFFTNAMHSKLGSCIPDFLRLRTHLSSGSTYSSGATKSSLSHVLATYLHSTGIDYQHGFNLSSFMISLGRNLLGMASARSQLSFLIVEAHGRECKRPPH